MRALVANVLAGLLLGGMVTVEQATAGDGMPWRIYDTMHDRPGSQGSLGRHGIVPAHVFMKGVLYEPGEDKGEPPSEKRVKEFARKIPHEVLTVMDLEGEDWNTTTVWQGDQIVPNTDALEALSEIASWTNEASPDLTWGFYGRVPPIRPYIMAWRRNHAGDEDARDRYLAMADRSNRELRPLYEHVDVITVSLYYSGKKHDSFEEYQGFCEFFFEHWENPTDKPVYVFMCPLDPYTNTSAGADFLTGEQWRWCMEFARENTDGLLLWSDVPFDWDVHAKGRPWWDETKKFPTRTPDQNGE